MKGAEHGAAMIMALLLSLLLLSISAVMLLESSLNSQNVTDAISDQQAYHASESGIQSAVHVMRCQKNDLAGCSDVVANPLLNSRRIRYRRDEPSNLSERDQA